MGDDGGGGNVTFWATGAIDGGGGGGGGGVGLAGDGTFRGDSTGVCVCPGGLIVNGCNICIGGEGWSGRWFYKGRKHSYSLNVTGDR